MTDDSVVELASRREVDDRVQPKPADSQLESEFGVGSNMPFSTPFRDGTSFEVLRELGYQSPTPNQLEVMRRTDGQARALYRLLTLPIRSALKNCTFVPEEGGDKEAEFIDLMFNLPPSSGGMTVPMTRVMAQLLMALFDGFAAFEQVYWVPNKGPLKGKFTLKKLAYRPSSTITFLADEHGGFNGLRQRTNFQNKNIDVKIDVENAVYYAANEEERQFYGVSYFESAFYHYDKKVRLYYIAHLAAQRAAVGTRKGKMPPNPQLKDKVQFIAALSNLGVAQYINLPEGYDVDLLKDSTSFDFLSYINHHNSQMSKSVLAAFFDTNQGGGKQDTSLVDFGQQEDAMFLLMLKTLMDEIAAMFNTHIIPKFIDWNFATGKYPKFTWGTFTDEQKSSIKSTFDKLAVAGQSMTVTPDFMFELEKYMAHEMGLEIDYKTIEAEKKVQKEQATKAAAAQAQYAEQAAAAAAQQFANPDQANPPEAGGPPPEPQQVAASNPLTVELSLEDLARDVLRESARSSKEVTRSILAEL